MAGIVFFVLVAAFVLAFVLYRVARALIETITVFEGQSALRYRKGRLVDTLGPGRYRIYRRTTKLELVDLRPSILTINGQEIVTSDGATLKLTLAAVYRVTDPKLARNEQQSFEDLLYLDLQLALRSLIAQKTVDELLESRGSLGADLTNTVSSKAAELGVELLSADLKDISLPGELRSAFAQTVQARKAGQAALERARGESAALRSLANAAKAVADRPELMQLRLLQQLESLSGNTLVFGLPLDGSALQRAGAAPEKKS
jgi:regulator of protease activity HflC (stomatin/prohibitin superfamily)